MRNHSLAPRTAASLLTLPAFYPIDSETRSGRGFGARYATFKELRGPGQSSMTRSGVRRLQRYAATPATISTVPGTQYSSIQTRAISMYSRIHSAK
jgi:hypothetical protein